MTAATPTQEQEKIQKVIDLLSPALAPLPYEIVTVEFHLQGQRKLLVYVDYKDNEQSKLIGIDDCVQASHALSDQLDKSPEIDSLFHGKSYELEVSSPGVDRPLRLPRHFDRFKGQVAKVQVMRPLTAEEMENPDYYATHVHQRTFRGVLGGVEDQKVVLFPRSEKESTEANPVRIPFPLIFRARLEADLKEILRKGKSNERK